MELNSLYFNKVYVFLFSAKTRIYKQNIHKLSWKRPISILFDIFSFYLEEMKVLSFSRAVNQLIMRVHKPKVEYKLALQEKPQGSNLDVLL